MNVDYPCYLIPGITVFCVPAGYQGNNLRSEITLLSLTATAVPRADCESPSRAARRPDQAEKNSHCVLRTSQILHPITRDEQRWCARDSSPPRLSSTRYLAMVFVLINRNVENLFEASSRYSYLSCLLYTSPSPRDRG